MILKVNDKIRYKRKGDYAISEGTVVEIDTYGNLFMLNEDLKIRTVCKISDVIEVIN